MKQHVLQYLACPNCAGTLGVASVSKIEDGEILDGELQCEGCSSHFPVVRGVPRFAELDKVEKEKAETAANFGWQWQHFTQQD